MLKILGLSICIALTAAAAEPVATSRLADFDQLVGWIREDYGPLEFKQTKLGFDLDGVTTTYREQIAKADPSLENDYLLHRYVAEFKDAHFSLRSPTTEVARLGFTTELVEGKVLIDTIDEKLLSKAQFDFARGDELLSIDGRPALALAHELSRYYNASYELTGLRMGVYSLASRSGSRVPLPSGVSHLVIRKRSTRETASVTLPWQRPSTFRILEPNPTFDHQLFGPVGLGDLCSETSRIQPPTGAVVISDVPFTAFKFSSAKGKIGFIRIPHYFPKNAAGEEIAAERFAQYERVIADFQQDTVGLVIDQDFNCGGSVIDVNKMFSLFYDQPFTPLSFEFRATSSQVSGLRNQLALFSVADEGYAEFKHVIDEIESARIRGEKFSPLLPMRGFMEVRVSMPSGNLIAPNAVVYGHPIVLLINEMSGSGGDVFPSLMKDFGRARLLGTRTMGAGGHIWDDPHLALKNSGAVVSLTRSLIYRRNGALIENAGIEPDVPYEITTDDFLHGYQGYLAEAVRALP